jgi:hypothetical protein
VIELRLGAHAFFVAWMPVPAPGGKAEDAARFSMASLAMRRMMPGHVAHLVITCTVVEPSLEDGVAFTRAVAAVASATDAVGVYWRHGHVTHPRRFFVDLARTSGLPVQP